MVQVICRSFCNGTSTVVYLQVFVLKRNRSIPLITAVISMPVSEAVVVV